MRMNPPTLLCTVAAAGVAADRFLPLLRFDVPWLPWAGGVLVALGAGIAVAGKRLFVRAGTNVYTFEQPDLLVSHGIYRFSRNPMYLGMVLVAAGLASVSSTLSAWLLWVAFAVAVRYWYIAYEEAAMRRVFGDRYDEYCRSVGRWL